MTPLRIGADTIRYLIPHRRPFLFVDGIEAFAREPKPTMTAFKHVSSNEPVFEGHFPGLSLWPGVYTIEGMGQTSNACLVLLRIIEGFEAAGATMELALDTLRAMDARARLAARPETDAERILTASLGDPRERIGFSGALDMKLIEPVFAGATIHYHVTLTHEMSTARRFDVQATVQGRPVARGSMTGTLLSLKPR